jgi:di-heme oxidoreductase (putative peroxidase)
MMRATHAILVGLATISLVVAARAIATAQIGREVSIEHHLAEGEEFSLSSRALLEHGRRLFSANWTIEEGGGRPLTKGTGAPIVDASDPLVFPRNFNRISAPDSNSCAGCHNAPFGIAGGGGDIVANVFVLGHRFDFATMNMIPDGFLTKGTTDERGQAVNLQNISNSRNTLGMFGSGYIEMLARQMTRDLQGIRDTIGPGHTKALSSKGVSFGLLARDVSGQWITSGVQGLPAPSLAGDPPNLIIRPFHQAGAVLSIRQFTNNAFNHHHGIQPTERFGVDTDPDGDGFQNEMTEADVTAATIFQATMAVPGRVIPTDPEVERAIAVGESRFAQIGCISCHTPNLPLTDEGWVFTEPNPFNPVGNRRPSDGPVYSIDLTSAHLPSPRLRRHRGVVWVPAFTDLKLHDICDGPDDPNVEPIDMQAPAGSPEFFAGNRRFLTRKLWGTANEPPYFHHGMFTTLRQAVLAHGGEAAAARAAFNALPSRDRDAIIEFLKSLQVLPPGTPALVVDERGHPRQWRSMFTLRGEES